MKIENKRILYAVLISLSIHAIVLGALYLKSESKGQIKHKVIRKHKALHVERFGGHVI